MAKKVLTPKTTKKEEPKVTIPITIGADGFPVPKIEAPVNRRFECICPICLDLNAKLQLTQKGTYLVQCNECKTIMYLNHSVSIALFRGLQKFYEENPDAKEFMSKAIVERAPQTSNEL
jgi:hypothetical protein